MENVPVFCYGFFYTRLVVNQWFMLAVSFLQIDANPDQGLLNTEIPMLQCHG